MTESQKIIFDIAIDKINTAISRQRIIAGAALGLNKDKEGNKIQGSEYENWARESDLMDKELKEGLSLLNIIKREINAVK